MLGQLRALPKTPNAGTDQHDLLWGDCPAVIVALCGGLLPALQQSAKELSEVKLLHSSTCVENQLLWESKQPVLLLV